MNRQENKRAYLAALRHIINKHRDYWPLTLRQVYYQLVASRMIPNSRSAYQKLSRELSKARLEGEISWEAIEDRSRALLESKGEIDREHFLEWQSKAFLQGYKRDLLQGQRFRLELWVEKDALSRLCHQVAYEYCIPVIVARGFSSVSYLHNARNRIEDNWRVGQSTHILYFGDLDPSGYEMLPVMMRMFREKMRITNLVTSERVALNPEQVEEYDLPHSPDAMKLNDPRTAKYREQFGDLAVELDALEPGILMGLVKDSIEENLDMELFNAQKQIQVEEIRELAAFKSRLKLD